MALVKVKRHFQVTIPEEMRKHFHLVEGDYMEMKNDGLVLKPVKVVLSSQAFGSAWCLDQTVTCSLQNGIRGGFFDS